MIQRHVLTDDFDFEKFDFFNDVNDTQAWLAGLNTPQAWDAHERLTAAYRRYLARQWERSFRAK